MKDCFGIELHEGDRIIHVQHYRSSVSIHKGTVTSASQTRVYYLDDNDAEQHWSVSSRVMKLESK